ncbi:hypothetical protein FXO38_13093 [Capsicum annuum]|nr:hypothetical protein FXO38_13093 [Capsicum annuum]
MDNPSSFSLEITQLDATVQDIPLGFSPATFDEQDPDWAENRSKHRNDPDRFQNAYSCLKFSRITKTSFMFGYKGKSSFFTMFEFVIISGLKCTGNIDDYMYTSSSKLVLMLRYFPDNKGAITRSKLITRVQNGNFDNVEDALNLAILFFVHTFMFSQHKEAPVSVTHFQIIEDGRYIHFSWGKHSYKNIQPATDEVRRLDLSFSKDFELCDPKTYDSTSDSGNLKRTAVEIQQLVGTIAEEFGDFNTIPLRKILIKAGFESPVSPDQPLKKRKIVISGHAVHHGSDLYRETHKDAANKGEIGSEASSVKKKTPAKRKRKKFRVLRSPYISKYGSVSKDAVDIDKEEKLKYAFDGYNINQDLPNELMINYSQWIAHLDVIFYHLRKKSKIQLGDNYRYTTTSYFFKTYVEKTHTRYYPEEPAVDLSTQQDYAESIMVAKNEDAIANIIQGFCMPAGLLWYMVDKEKEPPIEIQKLAVMLPTYLSDNDFYDKTERTDWPLLEAYKGKITQQTDPVNEIPFDVDYVQNIPQQASDCLDCGVFVCAYAEILSEGLQVHSCGFDSACQHAHYASLLWHYEVEKENEGYTSDNGDSPRPRKSVIEEIEANAIVTLE